MKLYTSSKISVSLIWTSLVVVIHGKRGWIINIHHLLYGRSRPSFTLSHFVSGITWFISPRLPLSERLVPMSASAEIGCCDQWCFVSESVSTDWTCHWRVVIHSHWHRVTTPNVLHLLQHLSTFPSLVIILRLPTIFDCFSLHLSYFMQYFYFSILSIYIDIHINTHLTCHGSASPYPRPFATNAWHCQHNVQLPSSAAVLKFLESAMEGHSMRQPWFWRCGNVLTAVKRVSETRLTSFHTTPLSSPTMSLLSTRTPRTVQNYTT